MKGLKFTDAMEFWSWSFHDFEAMTADQSGDECMLKITRLAEDSSRVTLKLEGRIVSEWVSLLEKECLNHRLQKKNVLLDCAGVSYVDAGGVDMLRRIMADGVAIGSCSPLLDSLLKS